MDAGRWSSGVWRPGGHHVKHLDRHDVTLRCRTRLDGNYLRLLWACGLHLNTRIDRHHGRRQMDWYLAGNIWLFSYRNELHYHQKGPVLSSLLPNVF